MIKMATKSFLKNITIKNSKAAENFIKALENAENKKSKVVKFDKRVDEIKDRNQIRKIFSKQKVSYKVINLKDIYNALGEKETKEILKDYECGLNKDVEYFLKEKAIEFSKQDISRTFIVMGEYKGTNVIVGYFAIANRGTTVKKFMLSNTKRKRILKFAKYDNEVKGYNIALPLIGQLGKNYHNGYNKLITGDILLKLACNKIKEIQNEIGGRYVILECEDNEKLKSFMKVMDLNVLEKEIQKKMKQIKILEGIYFKCYEI